MVMLRDYGQNADMDGYCEMPFMEDAGMPADHPPSDSPNKQPGGTAEEGSTAGNAGDAAARLPASSSAAGGDASKAAPDASGATPIASKAVQQLVRTLPACYSFTQSLRRDPNWKCLCHTV